MINIAVENPSIDTQLSRAYVELNRHLDLIERNQLENTDILTRPITEYSDEWYINNAKQILWATKSVQTIREAITFLENEKANTTIESDFKRRLRECKEFTTKLEEIIKCLESSKRNLESSTVYGYDLDKAMYTRKVKEYTECIESMKNTGTWQYKIVVGYGY